MKKIVLITGSNSGIGIKLVENLASKGYIVYAGVRSQKSLNAQGNLIRPIMLDISSDQDCKSAIKKIINEEGVIDVLINNAANTLSGASIGFTSQEYLDLLNINAVGAFRLIKEVYPYMKAKKAGKIINITSFNALVSFPNFGLYSSSKFAIEALGLALSYELAKDGICVTNIAPGAIFSNKQNKRESISHKTAREKFWIIRLLMPMVTVDSIAKKIEEIIECPSSPPRVVIGRDVKLTTLMQRLLPSTVWDWVMGVVWNKK